VGKGWRPVHPTKEREKEAGKKGGGGGVGRAADPTCTRKPASRQGKRKKEKEKKRSAAKKEKGKEKKENIGVYQAKTASAFPVATPPQETLKRGKKGPQKKRKRKRELKGAVTGLDSCFLLRRPLHKRKGRGGGGGEKEKGPPGPALWRFS